MPDPCNVPPTPGCTGRPALVGLVLPEVLRLKLRPLGSSVGAVLTPLVKLVLSLLLLLVLLLGPLGSKQSWGWELSLILRLPPLGGAVGDALL